MTNADGTKKDEFAILSSIWILASNDENPLMTYQGIAYRLGINDILRIKKLISDHQEIFRLYVSKVQVNEWKQDMNAGKRLPGWIRDMEDPEKKEAAIMALTPEDIFRSQFRVVKNSPKTQIEVIQWGLEHIERLRKADLEERTTGLKFLEVWGALILSAINLVLLVLSVFNIVK